MLGSYFSGKQRWSLASVIRTDDAEGQNLSKTFEFVFPEFASDHAESQRFWFGGAEWFFSTEKNADDDYIGVYLSLAQDTTGFFVKLNSYKFIVVDQEDETFNVEKSSVPKIFSFTQGWGFHKFIKLSELKRNDRSYLRTSRLVLRLEMTKATAIYDHLVDVSTLKLGSIGKFFFDSVEWMVRVIEQDGNISCSIAKIMSVPAVQYSGKVKITLINDNPNNNIKKKLGYKTWAAQKPQHGVDGIIKFNDLKSQKGWVRTASTNGGTSSGNGASPGGANAATGVPPVSQFLVRFEMKHMLTILEVPIPNLNSSLTGISANVSFDRQYWNLSCKKENNALSLYLHLPSPAEHKTYHTAFKLAVLGSKPDDDSNNLIKNFGTATFYKFSSQLGFTTFATVEDLNRIKAVSGGNLNVKVYIHKLDIATTYLEATVAKGGAAAVKLAKDEIDKFRKYYYTTRTELKQVKEQLDKATHDASSLQSKQGKFQLEIEPLQMALQAKTEAAETLLTDLEAERGKSAALKKDLDKTRESLGFMSMLWLESVKHVAAQVPSSPSPNLSPLSSSIANLPPADHTPLATIDILNTLKDIVNEAGSISSKHLCDEYERKKGVSLRDTLHKANLGTPLAFLESNLAIFQFEEPIISLKPKPQTVVRLSESDITSMAIKLNPSAESLTYLTEAFDFVTKFLPQVLPLPIINFCLAGDAGKGICLAGTVSVDVVAFIDKVPDRGHSAWLPPILTQLQRIIKVKLPGATNLAIDGRSISFHFESAHIKILPTAPLAPETMYQTIIQNPTGWYDAATAPQQVEFVRSQSEAVKSIIRIVSAWNHAANEPVEERPSSLLIELLAIHACTPKTSGASQSFDPVAALKSFFELVADFDNLRLFWERYYKIDIVPNSVFTERPLVLDPSNPTNNLAKGFNISAFKQRALEVIASEFTSLSDTIVLPNGN